LAKKIANSLVLLLMIIFGGCKSQPDSNNVVVKYSALSDQTRSSLVGDTEEFWRDVDLLYRASIKGDPNSIRTLFIIGSFSDGIVSEGMPDLSTIVEKYPEISKEVIMGNERLRGKYSHWLNSAQ